MIDRRKRIAVVGAGVSGLTAAWGLSTLHEVTLFESASYLGGHANTVFVKDDIDLSVDTGFIVFNEQNYPFFTAILKLLNVSTLPTSMSFGVSVDGGNFEYSSASLPKAVFSYSNLCSERFRTLVSGIARLYNPFKNKELSVDSELTIGDYLRLRGFKDQFIKDHVLPMTAAIWSSSLKDAELYPAETFINFFNNHRLLSLFNRPCWRTISGGSKEYVKGLVRDGSFKKHLNCPIVQVKRASDRAILHTKDGSELDFDEVVLACHADSALSLLSDASKEEQKVLADFNYSKNVAYLHKDFRLMPLDKRHWSSWNYVGSNLGSDAASPVYVTYWMNKLHGFKTEEQIFVTLNPPEDIKEEKVINTTEYAHPVIDINSLAGAERSIAIQGQNRIWFCGAYLGSGFHEDGVQSGLWVANQLGFSSEDLPSIEYSRLPDTYRTTGQS